MSQVSGSNASSTQAQINQLDNQKRLELVEETRRGIENEKCTAAAARCGKIRFG